MQSMATNRALRWNRSDYSINRNISLTEDSADFIAWCYSISIKYTLSMSNVPLSANGALRPELGIASEILLGVLLLALVYYVKVKLVRNTKDFVIANRKIGFGFGVAGLISIWTWAMAVMMSAAQTYSFGLSGLFWFTVPNGLAVIAAIPFVRKIRTLMPDGYTIPEFVKVRFGGNAVAGGVVVLGALFGSLIEVIINIKG